MAVFRRLSETFKKLKGPEGSSTDEASATAAATLPSDRTEPARVVSSLGDGASGSQPEPDSEPAADFAPMDIPAEAWNAGSFLEDDGGPAMVPMAVSSESLQAVRATRSWPTTQSSGEPTPARKGGSSSFRSDIDYPPNLSPRTVSQGSRSWPASKSWGPSNAVDEKAGGSFSPSGIDYPPTPSYQTDALNSFGSAVGGAAGGVTSFGSTKTDWDNLLPVGRQGEQTPEEYQRALLAAGMPGLQMAALWGGMPGMPPPPGYPGAFASPWGMPWPPSVAGGPAVPGWPGQEGTAAAAAAAAAGAGPILPPGITKATAASEQAQQGLAAHFAALAEQHQAWVEWYKGCSAQLMQTNSSGAGPRPRSQSDRGVTGQASGSAAAAGAGKAAPAGAAGGSDDEDLKVPDSERTTVMLRNIPNDYSRHMLLDLLDAEGFKKCYDFVYLPMDFKRQAGLGYAFVNLVDHSEAERFMKHFQGFARWKFSSSKICEAAWGTPLQGLAQHIERYKNSPLMHVDVPDEFKPILFRDGERIAFPEPSKRIRPPRVKLQCSSATSQPEATTAAFEPGQ